MGKIKDLTGQKFNRLTVIEFAGSDKWNQSLWKCRCECGKEVVVVGKDMTRGYTKSCGCLRKEQFKDLTGKKFNRLTVIEFAGRNKDRKSLWKCRCDCGNEVVVIGKNMRKGLTKSCGCFSREHWHKVITVHGCHDEVMYRRWQAMKTRCHNPNSPQYKNYGGRGITVCDEWRYDYVAFREWALSNGYDDTLELDRIDNNKGYSPENCRYVTRKENMNNTRINKHITFRGETRTMSEWSEVTGITYSALEHRFSRGWDVERALTTPTTVRNRR